MLKRWTRGTLTAVIVAIVVASTLGQAVAPAAVFFGQPALSADLGAMRIELKL